VVCWSGGVIMQRRLVMALLGLGVVGGYGAEIAHHGACTRWHRAQLHEQVVRDIAQACLNAARGGPVGAGAKVEVKAVPGALASP
jgi:hypothetical protein